MKKILLTVVMLCLSANTNALEVAGLKLVKSAQLGTTELVLNGAGTRTKLFFKVYVAALYLGKKETSAQAILDDGSPQRMALHMLRDLTDEQLLSPVIEGMQDNNTAAEMAAIEIPLKQMVHTFHVVGAIKQGQVMTLDYLPGKGTLVSVNGDARGTIPGEPFHRALMKIWLGDKPVQNDLKLKLLGGQ
jgi:hypothetical protein